MTKLFRGLEGGPDFGATSAEDFVAGAAVFLAELNAIHPFREGNGRSQLAFLHLLGDAAGYPFDLTRLDRDTFLPAMIASYDLNTVPLIEELRRLLAPAKAG